MMPLNDALPVLGSWIAAVPATHGAWVTTRVWLPSVMVVCHSPNVRKSHVHVPGPT